MTDGLQAEITALKARLFELDKEREGVNNQLMYKLGYADASNKAKAELAEFKKRIDGVIKEATSKALAQGEKVKPQKAT